MPSQVDYLHFETTLVHEDPEIGNQNRVYVQVHNRGPLAASNVTVKIMTAGASGGLPDLPCRLLDHLAEQRRRRQLDGSRLAADHRHPRAAASDRAGMELDPAAGRRRPHLHAGGGRQPVGSDPHRSKVFDIAQLVTGEKRVGLKNLHLVNLLPSVFVPIHIDLWASKLAAFRYIVRLPSFDHPDLGVTMLFSKALSKRVQAKSAARPDGGQVLGCRPGPPEEAVADR